VWIRAGSASFPRRNRVIAALATLTIVVEAGGAKRGLITAGTALDIGRDVGPCPVPSSHHSTSDRTGC
jgi:DNA processing protein